MTLASTRVRPPGRTGAGGPSVPGSPPSARTPRVLPTLEMVAAEAGVSRSTVSRVVNGSEHVRPSVVEAVQAAIEKLDYVPNRAARSLASQQTRAIALVVPEDTDRFFGDPYFASIVRGITSRLHDSDYILNLLVVPSDGGRTLRYLQGGNVDGALVISHHARNTDLFHLADRLPVVFGARPLVGARDSYYVDVDNLGGAIAAARHLIDTGRRRIATIAGPADMPASRDRLEGWRSGLTAAGLPADAIVTGDFTEPGGAAAAAELLDRWPDVDGVFAANDMMARAALAVFAERGRRVPDDLAVVGYDDSPAAVVRTPLLTTVRQPSVTMGEKMTEMLLGLLRGVEPAERACLLPTELVVRDTA